MLLLVVLAAVILVLALMPPSGGSGLFGWDKADHVAAFSALAFCGVYGLRGRPGSRTALWVGLLALGIAIEWGQMFIPGRSSDWVDVVADAAGIAFGMALAQGLAVKLDRRTRPRPDDAAG